MKSHLKVWGSVLLLCIAATQAPGQSRLATLQAAAEEALIAGDPAETATLSRAMIAENPDSFAGHFLLALALSDLEQHSEAAKAAGRAYRNAPTEDDKLQSARLAGSSRFAAAQYARSELWLRRAANHVDTEQEAERVVREFQRARAANPLSMQFSGSIAPTDNVNSGSSDGVICFEGLNNECTFDADLPENQLPLSGVEFSGSAQFGYRLSQTDRQTTTASLLLFGQAYALSSDAKDLLASSPDEDVQAVTASDFATVVTQVSLAQRQSNLSPLGPTSIAVNLGKYWRGGDPLVNYQDIILGQDIPINTNAAVLLKASTRNQTALSPLVVDSVAHEISGTYATTLGNDDVLRLTLKAKHSDGGFENVYEEYRAGIDYAFAQPILNTRWSTSFELGYRSYDEFSLTFDGRRDRFASIGADVVFEDVSYFGFSPSMSFEATKTESDVVSVNSSQVQVRFGVSSNF